MTGPVRGKVVPLGALREFTQSLPRPRPVLLLADTSARMGRLGKIQTFFRFLTTSVKARSRSAQPHGALVYGDPFALGMCEKDETSRMDGLGVSWRGRDVTPLPVDTERSGRADDP